MPPKTDRRRFITNSILGVSGAIAIAGREENSLLAALRDGVGVSDDERREATRDPMPCGKLGDVELGRLMLGSNLINGFAHSRDLLYVSQLFKAYNTEQRVFDTFELAEQTGVNSILTNPVSLEIVHRYNRQRGGNLKSVVYVRPYADAKRARDEVDRVVELGACAISTHGEETDKLVRDERYDPLVNAIECIHRHGLPAGLGAHSLETPKAAEREGLGADFYHKTLHHDRYWSAIPRESRKEWCWYQPRTGRHEDYNDNMFCLDADATIEFMSSVRKPWIAFKVLAAGAIDAEQGFTYAFRNGADFICVGMFDFQLCEDALHVKKILSRLRNRKRPWMA